MEYIGKRKARQPFEFAVRVNMAITHTNGLVVGVGSFTSNPYDGHTVLQQQEQTNTSPSVGPWRHPSRPGEPVLCLLVRREDHQAAGCTRAR